MFWKLNGEHSLTDLRQASCWDTRGKITRLLLEMLEFLKVK